MWASLKEVLKHWLFADWSKSLIERQNQLTAEVNQRVADALTQMDPFEPLMKKFHGIFTEDYEHPEEKLDPQSVLRLSMWAYQQKTDPQFNFLMDWIENTQANATLKRRNPTPETILYGRAAVAAPILLRKEVGRLGLLYEDMLAKQKGEDFNSDVIAE